MSKSVIILPRGGFYVKTSAGPVQFGLPPETIKDAMALGLEVPTAYVVPHELFDRRRGINVSECEFPAYYNYFARHQRVRLFVDNAGIEARLRAVFEEALFGPSRFVTEGEFAQDVPAAVRPDFAQEFRYFRRNRDGQSIELEALVDFRRFDPQGRVTFAPGVEIRQEVNGAYTVNDQGHDIATVPAHLSLPPRPRSATGFSKVAFAPPAFGITVLGASHGFDPAGKTTGFIVWIGHRGLLVDPPVDATHWLYEQGVPPKLLDGVLLTHCHADHDSGTFQKLLDEGRVTLYTTPTILNSFLKKYASLSAINEDTLRRTFAFTPVQIGAPTRIRGAEFWFRYTLHSIPAIGFEVFYGGKSLVVSGDTLYDPPRLRDLATQGVLTAERCADLIDFPWHHTVIIHEAGVPPLHTPAAALAALPSDVKERLYLVHTAERDIPPNVGLKAASVGLEQTLRIDVTPPAQNEAIDVLEAFCAVELFRDFPLARAGEILHVARPLHVRAEQRIIEQGTKGDAFYLIASGVVAVLRDGHETRIHTVGDFFGETALLLDQPRNADVVAKTDVTLIAVSRYDFLYLLRGTDLPERLVRLARARAEHSWDVLEQNSSLRLLTNGQKNQIQSFFVSHVIGADAPLWEAGDVPTHAYLLDDAEVRFDESMGPRLELFRTGALLGEFDALVEERPATSTARVVRTGRVFAIARDDWRRWLGGNPGMLVALLGARFVE